MAARQAVEVTWEDAAACTDSWHDEEEAAHCSTKTHLVRTVGLMVSRTKRSLMIARSQGPQGQLDGLLRVPAGMIRKVRRLK